MSKSFIRYSNNYIIVFLYASLYSSVDVLSGGTDCVISCSSTSMPHLSVHMDIIPRLQLIVYTVQRAQNK